jgi:hypothetical protein
MVTPILKVAKKGYDIRTAEPQNLNIDSTKNQFKVYEEGEGTVSFVAKAGGSSYQRHELDISHNLGYQPAYLFFMKSPDGKVRLSPFLGTGSTGPTNVSSGAARVDDNTLRLYFYVWDIFLAGYSAFDVEYKYFIFVDPNKNVWNS